MLNTYGYIKNDGERGQIQAPDSNTAINTAPNRTPRSGVINENVTPNEISNHPAADPDIMKLYNAGIFNSNSNQKTIGDLLGGSNSSDLYDAYNPPEVDDKQIRRDVMSQFQGQIDATNRLYDTMVNEARVEGQSRLGGQRAISARSGALGSDFGAANKENVLGANRDIHSGIQAERGAKIQAIMGLGSSAAVEEIRAKRQARQQGIENYTSYLAAQTERDNGKLAGLSSELIRLGLDPNDMTSEELAQVAEQYGLNENQISNHYSETIAAEEAAALEAERETTKFNQETGKYDLDIRKGEATIESTNALTDSRNRSSQPKPGDDVNVRAYSDGLSASVGADGNIAPKDYNEAKQEWIADGGKASDFDENFFGFINNSHSADYDISASFEKFAKDPNNKVNSGRDTGIKE